MKPLTVALIGGALGIIAAALYKAPDIRAKLSTYGPEFDNLHPDVKAAALAVLEDCKAEGLSVGIYRGFATLSEEQTLIDKGAAQIKNPAYSYHAWGLAVDFVFLDAFGRWSWLPDPENPKNTAYVDPRWYQLGGIIERHGFTWGGRWRWFDGAHGQMDSIANVASLNNDYAGNPETFINTFA